ncbi:MAG: glycosyltransferase [Gemmatimonadales bacterium]|jgi:glycosyltransferase involved in cell wall biosynthesis|nr:glycosyltransferase [Gemmatimonadales bacterium]MBT3774679.1 glycosyltransferase [Gemmatimonadales bacterium]MBT3958763.1 glycosyltransferase [Gemmatimonadales bacterium]MBT4436402.1 glycosyltransferase [Gemmatimonadales bacterium]MBT4912597.1 glycosyltransferase [Gemmatimonadales bacterium]
MTKNDFAVIVPAFNEAEVIPDLVRELREAFERFGLDGEVILVDDGSSDDTAAIAERESAGWDAFKVVKHNKNLGKTEAMITGADATEKTALVIFDADLQHTPSEIPRFLEKLSEGWDIVTGRKVGAYDKRGVSSVYNRLSRKIFDVPVSDLNSMKAFRREVLDGLTLRHDWHRFFVVLAHSRGATVTEIDIELHDRRAGESKFQGPFRILVGVMDLMSVGFLLLFSRKPLLFFGASGILMAGLGVFVAAIAVYLRFVHPMAGFDPYIPPMGYRPLLYLVMLLEMLGFVLVGFGLVSEQVAQVRYEIDNLRRNRKDSGS